MQGLVNPSDTGNQLDQRLRASAVEKVREMLPDNFGKAYKDAKAMVGKLNIEVESARVAQDRSFRDIRTFAKPLGGYWYLTGPFKVAVLDTSLNTGPIISILGVEVDPTKIYEERIGEANIKFEEIGRKRDEFLKSLIRNQLPLGNGGFFRGQLKVDWGNKAGQSFEVGGIGSKNIPGVRDITKEVEALLGQ